MRRRIYIYFAFSFNIFVESILATPLSVVPPAVEPSEKLIRSENIGPGWTSSWEESLDTGPDSGQFVAWRDQISAEGNDDVNWNNVFSQPASTSYDQQQSTNAGSRQQLYADGEPSTLPEGQVNTDCDDSSGNMNGAGKLHSRGDGSPPGICKVEAENAAATQVAPAPVLGDFPITMDRLRKKSCASLLLYAIHACCAGTAAQKINGIYPFIDNCVQQTGVGCLLDYEVCCERWALTEPLQPGYKCVDAPPVPI